MRATQSGMGSSSGCSACVSPASRSSDSARCARPGGGTAGSSEAIRCLNCSAAASSAASSGRGWAGASRSQSGTDSSAEFSPVVGCDSEVQFVASSFPQASSRGRRRHWQLWQYGRSAGLFSPQLGQTMISSITHPRTDDASRSARAIRLPGYPGPFRPGCRGCRPRRARAGAMAPPSWQVHRLRRTGVWPTTRA